MRVIVLGIKGDRVRLGIDAPRAVSVDRGEVHARKVQIVEVPFEAASAVCDETIDLGGVLVVTAADALR